MFHRIFLIKTIICILLLLLFKYIYISSIGELKDYMKMISYCNKWVLSHSDNDNDYVLNGSKIEGLLNNSKIMQVRFIKDKVIPLLKTEVNFTLRYISPKSLNNYYKNLYADLYYEIYEPDIENINRTDIENINRDNIRCIYLQWYDKTVNSYVRFLFPKTLEYLQSMYDTYCCKLILMPPHSTLHGKTLLFEGLIETIFPVINTNLSLEVNDLTSNLSTEIPNKTIKKIANEPITFDPTKDIKILNSSDKYALFLSCQTSRVVIHPFNQVLNMLNDRLASLTDRFKISYGPANKSVTE